MYMNAAAVLYYAYTDEIIFVTQFLKSNIFYL